MVITITYFVHGTTIDNEQGLSTGHLPGELSELGIRQSKELEKIVAKKKVKFDVIFCSDLKRAVDSAQLTFPKQKIIKDKRLRECDYGDLNGATEDEVIYEEHIRKQFPQGESLHDVEKRIRSFIDFLKRKYSVKTIAIVAHKAPQLALEVLLKGKTWEEALAEDWRKRKAWQPGWEYIICE